MNIIDSTSFLQPSCLPIGTRGSTTGSTDLQILWRGSQLAQVSVGQPITIDGGSDWNGDGTAHPCYYKDSLNGIAGLNFPAYATTDVNTANSNTLVLGQRTKIFQIRGEDSWNDTPVAVSYTHLTLPTKRIV